MQIVCLFVCFHMKLWFKTQEKKPRGFLLDRFKLINRYQDQVVCKYFVHLPTFYFVQIS